MGDSPANLMDFVASMGGERKLRVEENLGAGFVRLRVAEAERRQAKHDIRCAEDAVVELLRNSRDAGAQRIFVATSRTGDLRTITVLDDGGLHAHGPLGGAWARHGAVLHQRECEVGSGGCLW